MVSGCSLGALRECQGIVVEPGIARAPRRDVPRDRGGLIEGCQGQTVLAGAQEAGRDGNALLLLRVDRIERVAFIAECPAHLRREVEIALVPIDFDSQDGDARVTEKRVHFQVVQAARRAGERENQGVGIRMRSHLLVGRTRMELGPELFFIALAHLDDHRPMPLGVGQGRELVIGKIALAQPPDQILRGQIIGAAGRSQQKKTHCEPEVFRDCGDKGRNAHEVLTWS